jgi:hypothetical protein
MKIITWNLIKVFIGFIFGTVLLYFIVDLPILVVSLIQMIFFTILYSFLDRMKKKIENRKLSSWVTKYPIKEKFHAEVAKIYGNCPNCGSTNLKWDKLFVSTIVCQDCREEPKMYAGIYLSE